MTFPIVLAKSLLSLSLLSAALPAGGAAVTASAEIGSSGTEPAKSVHVIRSFGEGQDAGFTISVGEGEAFGGQNVLRTSVIAIPDPLELAQTYAPETVEEWTQTLEQLKEKWKPQMYRVQMAAAPEGEETGDVTLPVEIAIRTMPAVKLDTEAGTLEDGAALKSVTVDVREAVAIAGGVIEGQEPAALPTEVKVFPLDEGIVTAQAAVGKALEAGQAEEIRTALQHLLTAYQSFLAKN